MDRIRSECPGVEWVHNFAVLRPYDYLDVFQPKDMNTVFKVATIIRTFAHAHTEIWAAKQWKAEKGRFCVPDVIILGRQEKLRDFSRDCLKHCPQHLDNGAGVVTFFR